MTLLRKIADTLAVILHPVFLFFNAFLGYWIFTSQVSNPITNFLEIFILTVAVPIAAVMLLAGDIHLHNRKKRFLPLAVALVAYIIAHRILDYDTLPPGLFPLLLPAIILSTILILVLTIYLKVSMHANAYGIVMFMLMILWYQAANNPLAKALIFLAFILMFLVLWQRLVSGAHKIMEIIIGLSIGVLSAALILFLYTFDIVTGR
jgi:hypothetical protein